MRVTSDFFVSALTRRVFGDGGFATVLRKGATEAGAIFITTRNRMGELTLYGPAPQTFYEEERPNDRRFAVLLANVDEAEQGARIAKELRFDPDVWLVEIEPGQLSVEDLIKLERS